MFNQGAKYVLVHLNAVSGLIDLEGWFRYINQDSFWTLINLEVWFRYFNQDLFRTHKPGRLNVETLNVDFINKHDMLKLTVPIG